MVTAAHVTLPPDSTGKKLGAVSLTNEETQTVLRQELVIADPVIAANRLMVIAEDAAAANGDTGLLTFMKQHAAESSDVGSDGDYAVPQSDAIGRMKVNSRPMTPTTANYDSAATVNSTLVAAGVHTLYNITASNVNAAARYLKIYDKATAPTVGTDVPKLTIPIPLAGIANINFGALGMQFALGIGFGLTTGATDADTNAVAIHEQKVVFNYV